MVEARASATAPRYRSGVSGSDPTDDPSRPPPSAGAPVDRVELSVPADPAYLAVLRTATAGLAARADMTIDEIEDLRIAVDEACALVLGDDAGGWAGLEPPPGGQAGVAVRGGGAAPGTGARAVVGPPTIDAVFELGHQGMLVQVSGPSAALPERSSFAWSVLEALVDTLDAGIDHGGRRSITLRHGTRRAS